MSQSQSQSWRLQLACACASFRTVAVLLKTGDQLRISDVMPAGAFTGMGPSEHMAVTVRAQGGAGSDSGSEGSAWIWAVCRCASQAGGY